MKIVCPNNSTSERYGYKANVHRERMILMEDLRKNFHVWNNEL